MAGGPYVLVNVQGTNADGLFCVRSKEPEPLTMVYDPIADDHEVVRVVVSVDYVDEMAEGLAHVALPISFNTTRLYVLGGGPGKPDQNFCQNFLDEHGVKGIPAVNLGQRQARLQEAEVVQYGEQPGPRRRSRVEQSESISHRRDRDSQAEGHSEGLSTRSRNRSLTRGPYHREVIYAVTCMATLLHDWHVAYVVQVCCWLKKNSCCPYGANRER